MYYFYRKSNRGHEICPLYRGCLLLRESAIRGFTAIMVIVPATCDNKVGRFQLVAAEVLWYPLSQN